jgi:hypothetical protein
MFDKEEFIGDLLNKKIATFDDVEGVSSAEISQLENSFRVILPNSYKEFLLAFGRKAGNLFSDVNFFFPDILKLKDELEEMIDEESLAFRLPDNAFVFSAYQGFQYHYFVCDGNEDPAVYRILDGGHPPEKVSESFTAYFRSSIN